MSKQNQNTLQDIRQQLTEVCRHSKRDIKLIEKILINYEEAGGSIVSFIADKSQDGFSPFLQVCAFNDITAVELFIRKYKAAGSKVAGLINSKNSYNQSPLLFACYNNNTQLAYLLMQEYKVEGEDVADLIDSKDSDGDTPLLFACRYNNIKLIEFFINNAGNKVSEIVNSKDSNNHTTLLYACQHGTKDVIELLIKNAGDNDNVINLIKGQNKQEDAPLIYACRQYKNEEMIKFLIESYIKVKGNIAGLINAKNNQDENALLEVLRQAENIEIVKYLLNHGGDLEILPKKLFVDEFVEDILLKLIKPDSGFDYNKYRTSTENTIFDYMVLHGSNALVKQIPHNIIIIKNPILQQIQRIEASLVGEAPYDLMKGNASMAGEMTDRDGKIKNGFYQSNPHFKVPGMILKAIANNTLAILDEAFRTEQIYIESALASLTPYYGNYCQSIKNILNDLFYASEYTSTEEIDGSEQSLSVSEKDTSDTEIVGDIYSGYESAPF